MSRQENVWLPTFQRDNDGLVKSERYKIFYDNMQMYLLNSSSEIKRTKMKKEKSSEDTEKD